MKQEKLLLKYKKKRIIIFFTLLLILNRKNFQGKLDTRKENIKILIENFYPNSRKILIIILYNRISNRTDLIR